MIKYDEEKFETFLEIEKKRKYLTYIWQPMSSNASEKVYPYISKSKKYPDAEPGFSISFSGKSNDYRPVSITDFINNLVNDQFPKSSNIRMDPVGEIKYGSGYPVHKLIVEKEFYEITKLCEIKTGIREIEELAKINIELEKSVDAATKLSSKELDEKIIQYSAVPEKVEVLTTVFKRNPYVIAKRLEIANGVCENCNQPAPFSRKSDNTPYLEVHHRTFLSDGGEDTVENTIALCPNCHRKIHFGI